MQKKHLFIPFIVLSLLLSPLSSLAALPAQAGSPSPSPSPSPANIDVVTDNLKKRLQESLSEDTTSSSLSSLAYVGVVKDVIKDTIVIEDKDGKKDVQVTKDTTLVRSPAGTSIKIDNVRIDDYIIAIGTQSETDTLIGQRLVLSVDPIKPPAKQSGYGIVKKITKTALTLESDGEDQILSLTTKTTIKSALGTLELTDLSVGDTLIYTSTVGDKDALTATILMRVQTASISE